LGPRVNCESAPCLPAAAIARVLDDPRQLPYLMVWQDRDGGGIREAVRVARHSSESADPRGLDWADWVEFKRPDGARSLMRTVERALPRNGGKALLLICQCCQAPRRALYGWEVDRTRRHGVFVRPWQCRTCAGLRYASEGGALVVRVRGALSRLRGPTRWDRPERWYPYVFSDPADAKWLGGAIIEAGRGASLAERIHAARLGRCVHVPFHR
jgi:hypothetical protein